MDDIKPRLYRRKDTAKVLGCSESMTVLLEQRGVIQPLNLRSVAGRMVRHDAEQVDALAERWITEAKAGR